MAFVSADPEDIKRTDGSAHRFRIDYSKIKDLGMGRRITSPTFISEGYRWAINFYPKGSFGVNNHGEFSSIFLCLLDDHVGLNVSSVLGVVQGDGTQGAGMKLNSLNMTFNNEHSDLGVVKFIARTTLEEEYVINGFFVILCTINMKDKVIDKLPIVEDVSKLWRSGEMTDVKFEVEGEIISAHRVILGARSPVFKAEFFGSMSETRLDCVRINDMKPEVFKALLNFLYTCSLPDDGDSDMFQYLLVAADRYGVECLVKKCENKLRKNIYLETVVSFLICAERYKLRKLKKDCLAFATQEGNFTKLALRPEYNEMTRDFPSLLVKLNEMII